ncbi:hypothetical protein QR680_015216 [Steinernema hermaphroditum]|uniref:Uncharacterized protein n=1 Tax=Steinernema hermaphroditum TaxID=289476 RepID=A0AA39IBL1_9BILA|nr:hypothetical protein QR680_015216 [Steinernema hermaphroditum]
MMAPSVRPVYASPTTHSATRNSTTATIQERTRQLLGWTDTNQVFTTADPSASTSAFIRKLSNSSTGSYRMSPYQKHRARRNSCSSSSTCSSDYSQPSPSNVQRYYSCPDSPESMDFTCNTRSTRDVQVFERVRRLLPVLPNDSNALQVLVDTVSHVIDLEQQLEELNEHAELLRQQQHTTPMQNECFPDDLETVDVSAFKHLICSDNGYFPFDACLTA